jgi:NAD(P)-dependent dehydrogenase (short-subunit alcohol dehydrogenase family)
MLGRSFGVALHSGWALTSALDKNRTLTCRELGHASRNVRRSFKVGRSERRNLMSIFSGSSALITGGGSGIGQATALALAAQGASVTIADLNVAGGKETVKQIEAEGGIARSIECDVADDDSVRAAVELAVGETGRLDIGVNCAGLRGPGMGVPLLEYDLELFDRLVATNLRGIFLSMRHELRYMVPHNAGSIVNISSRAGITGTPGTAAYTASKHGVVGLTKTAALDYASRSIKINVICPGLIDTPMNRTGRTPERMQSMIDGTPLHRKGQPSEIADAVLWLCSPESSFVTGSTLEIDGGMAALR